MEKLKELLEKKRNTVVSDIEKEKISVIEKILNEEGSFFNMSPVTAFGILNFLGVPKDEIYDFYKELVSFDEFSKLPKQYVVIDDVKTK